MQQPITRYLTSLSVTFATAVFTFYEPFALGLLSMSAGAAPNLLPSGVVSALDSDNDSYPKDTDGFYLFPAEDCNDVNASVYPSAPEQCNGLVDDNCNGCRDEGCADPAGGIRPTICDADNDGSDSPNDCNNLNASISPGATEICNNGYDDNCNGLVDAADLHCQAQPNPDPGVSWRVLDGPQNICLLNPEINPDLITIPDENPGCLPTAKSGTHAWWFGGNARGSYLGDEAELPQNPKNGGESEIGKVGSLTTPIFTPTSAEGRLHFFSWWEIESVDAHNYDVLRIVALDQFGDETEVVKLNPITDASWGRADLHYASGYNSFLNEAAVPSDPFLAPAWVPYTVALPAETVRVIFRFDARDALYNGFRGWLIDDVQVTDGIPVLSSTQKSAALGAGGAETTLFSDDLEGNVSGWQTDVIFNQEVCGNCVDDDEDGLIDLLDSDCPTPLALAFKSAGLMLKPDSNEDQVTAQSSFSAAGVTIDPPSEGVTFSVLDPNVPNKKLVCMQIPPGSAGWTLKGTTWTFKDQKDASLGDPLAKEQISIKQNAKKGVFEVKVNQKQAEVMNAREGALATEVIIGNDRFLNQQAWTFNKKGTKLSTK